ncbi:low temperature requirement protein A [Candidatus Finniella inopinata]|nr:low temperature requirement protein A [Candidatus Finniella inopinata]
MNLNSFFKKPALLTDSHNHNRKVGWLDLFLDLYFVVVISKLAHHIMEHPNLKGLAEFILLFVCPVWIWMLDTFYKERFETDNNYTRFNNFLLMFIISGFAIFSHHAFGKYANCYIITYIAAHLLLDIRWLQTYRHVDVFSPIAKKYLAGSFFSLSFLMAAIYIEGSTKYIFWTIALVFDHLIPLFTVKEHKKLPAYSKHRLPERFGLFLMIILGELVATVVNELSQTHELRRSQFANGFLVLLIGFAFWWLYFDLIAGKGPKKKVYVTFIWSYLHIPLFIALTAGAVFLSYFVAFEPAIPAKEFIVLSALTLGCSLLLKGMIAYSTDQDLKYSKAFHQIVLGATVIGLGIIFKNYRQEIFLLSANICLYVFILTHIKEAWSGSPVED